jgi:hypothetical protein
LGGTKGLEDERGCVVENKLAMKTRSVDEFTLEILKTSLTP